MAIARSMQQEIERSSWIRRIFEKGQVLKQRLGEQNVFDFSLGNPILEPPGAFLDALRDLINNPFPGMHRYMPNAGFSSTRKVVAGVISKQEQMEVEAEDLIITAGAAGAMNVALKSILDPGDEVILLAPFFVEYRFYVTNHGGVIRVVETTDSFDLDLAAIEAAINPRTKAIIINTPQNPTGAVFPQEEIDLLAEVLDAAQRRLSKQIFVLADTPYARITFDGAKNPLLFSAHPSTLIAHSHSKDMGLAGQRIGYLAINPLAPDREALRSACTITNRTLGFVNAPALMQQALARSIHARVDTAAYTGLRDLLCHGLEEAGYELQWPRGGFYVFPRTPIPDDVLFAEELQRENVLVVPGSGFGRAGHIRLAFCVTEETIAAALPIFSRVIERVRSI